MQAKQVVLLRGDAVVEALREHGEGVSIDEDAPPGADTLVVECITMPHTMTFHITDETEGGGIFSNWFGLEVFENESVRCFKNMIIGMLPECRRPNMEEVFFLVPGRVGLHMITLPDEADGSPLLLKDCIGTMIYPDCPRVAVRLKNSILADCRVCC